MEEGKKWELGEEVWEAEGGGGAVGMVRWMTEPVRRAAGTIGLALWNAVGLVAEGDIIAESETSR